MIQLAKSTMPADAAQQAMLAIAAIDLQITPLRAEIAAEEARSAGLAYGASTGDRAAADEIAKIRTHRLGLEDRLHTLQQGRAVAEGRHQAEQSGQAAAEAEAGRDAATALVVQRIEAAARFDAAAAALQEAYETYFKLGRALAGHPFCPLSQVGGGMSTWESAWGNKRVLAAMPALMAMIYPTGVHHPRSLPLAQTEAALWGLPQVAKADR